VVIPRLQKGDPSLASLANDFADFSSRIADVDRYAQIMQPQLCSLAAVRDVNVWRLSPSAE
jgi:hypothetical protein